MTSQFATAKAAIEHILQVNKLGIRGNGHGEVRLIDYQTDHVEEIRGADPSNVRGMRVWTGHMALEPKEGS